ncbi:hypothetical protein M0L20_23050 [Spirosoma sp. RP8]|uniref:DUF4270 domain-containing protein n=1 Tax=Spirosoma liriopis TaxID=2937440 RepID=A0ABT0HTD0_9BACT|nr:hypothetical protein [Spirosoma liriopis]MCK8494765.1 hypothetical protein [Spirosoma liriopis]
MRLITIPACLSTVLAFTLLACQSPEHVDELIETAKIATVNQTSSYLFTGAPGVRNTTLDDITGTMVGSIDGQPIAFGPDKSFPLEAFTAFNNTGSKASVIRLHAQNAQYNIILNIRGPFEAGRNYIVYDPSTDNGESKDDPYIVSSFIRIPEGQIGRDILNLADPNNQFRITAITPEYVDIEFFFTLKKAGATQERLNIRIKNVLNENLSLRTQSEGEPFWDYTKALRKVEAMAYVPWPAGGLSNYLTPTTTRVTISQTDLNAPVSDITYEGITKPANWQAASLYRTRAPQERTQVEFAAGTMYSDEGYQLVEITWPNFTGVGVYTGDQVKITFANALNNQPNGDYWSIKPYLLASTTTKWQVNVQRVTSDLIEGTYTIVDAPLYEKRGTTLPASASASGRFKVIYPR